MRLIQPKGKKFWTPAVIMQVGGKVPAPPAFVSIGNVTDAGSGSTTISLSANIGAAAAGRVILIAATTQSGSGYSGATVNAVAMTAISITTPGPQAQFFYLVGVGPGSGTQSIVATGGQFQNRLLQAWTLNGLGATTPKQTAGSGASTANIVSISVTAGDSLFAVTGTVSGATNFNGSTQTPSDTYDFGATVNATAADWTVGSTNASFAVTASRFGSLIAVTFA
jgi:hypothetical protein